MTKKNKLLSLICLAVLAIVCACGMMFSGSTFAKADTPTFPTVDVSSIDGVDLKVAQAGASIKNANAHAADAKWIIFEWANENAGLRGGNPSNSFHMAVKNDGSFGTGAMPIYTGNYVTTAATTKIYVDLTTGDAYYERADEEAVKFNTFALPELADGQYYTVSILFNGFEASGTNSPEGACYKMNDLKIYDDKGTDLGVATSGTWIPNVPGAEAPADNSDVYVSTGVECTYISSKTATKSEWIYMSWTNLTPVAVANGANSAYCKVGETAGLAHGTSLGAGLWNAYNKNGITDGQPDTDKVDVETIKIAFNTKNGNVYKSVNGGFYVSAGTIAGVAFDGNTDVYACFCIHKTNTAKITNVKVYDGNGVNLGFTTSMTKEVTVPSPDVSGIEGIDLKTKKSDGNYIANESAPSETAKWIIFDWTNGPDGSAKINNPANSFHMAVKNDGSFGTGAMPVMTGGYISVYDARVRILVNLENGEAYYEVNGANPVLFNTFSIPALGQDQYYTVTVLVNGLTNNTENYFFMNGLKCYDDLGKDLGIKRQGSGWEVELNIPNPDVSGIDGEDYKSTGVAETYIANATGTKSRWIFMEWTNLADALENGAGSGQVYIGTDANGKHSLGDPATFWYMFNVTHAETVKLAFDTNTGEIYRSINGSALSLAATIDGIAFDGSVDVYANFCIHKANVAEIEGLKIYDGEGNDLGINTSMYQPLGVNPDVDAIAGVDLKIKEAQGFIINANAPATGAKWIVFDWTNGPDGSGMINNPQNSFHMAVKNDGTTGTGAMPVMTGGTISKYDAHVRILVSLESGDAYYEINGVPTKFNTFVLPALGDGQYYTVTMLLNGFADTTKTFYMNGLKCYDDLGTDLGVTATGKWLPDVPVVDASSIDGEDYKSTGAAETYIANANGTTSRWIFMEWTNKADALENGAGSGYVYIGTDANGKHAKGDAANLWFLFNANQIVDAKLAFDTQTGKVYRFTATGDFVLATTIDGIAFDGSVDVYANFCIHKANIAELEGLKIYDGEGNNLGINTTLYQPLGVDPDVDAIDGVDLRIKTAQGSLKNTNAPGAGAKWVVFDWTNGADGSGKINNPANSFHMTVKNDGTVGANAMPVMTGGTISKYDAHVRILVSLESGDAYYEIDGAPTKMATLTLPTLEQGQYYTVGMLLNGFADSTKIFYMNDLKCYDDLGNDLGITKSGPFLIDVPSPDVSGIDGVAGESLGNSCAYVASNTATTSEWIILEWTNVTETALANGAGSGFVYIGTSAGLQHSAGFAANLWTIMNKNADGSGEFVKLAFNTRNGNVYKSINGGDYTSVGQISNIAFDGTTAVYACFCLHKANTAEITDVKAYDAEGNDLGVNTNFGYIEEKDVKFVIESINPQPDNKSNIGTVAEPVYEKDARWLVRISVVDVETEEPIMPTMITFGGTDYSLNINGEDVTPVKSSSMYNVGGTFTWVLYAKTLAEGVQDFAYLPPVTIKFAEGTVYETGNYEITLVEDLYLHFSNLQGFYSTTGDMQEVFLAEDEIVGSAQDANVRYQVGAADLFVDGEGQAVADFGMLNFYGNLNGKTGTKTLISSKYEANTNLFEYKYLTEDAETKADVAPRYFYISEGTVIGANKVLGEDLVLVINGNDFRFIKPDAEGYAITYVVDDGITHTNPATFDYATSGFIALANPTNPDPNAKFLGWFDQNDKQVTSLAGITSDVTLTAKYLSSSLWQVQAIFDGEKFDVVFYLKASMPGLELAMKFQGYTVANGVDATANFTGLGANEYVYKFVAEDMPMSEVFETYDFTFETAIEVLANAEGFILADYFEALYEDPNSSAALKALVLDTMAYINALDADPENDDIPGISTVPTVAATDVVGRKGTEDANYVITDPIAVAYVDGKYQITVKAKVTEMSIAALNVTIGGTTTKIEDVMGAEDMVDTEYTFAVDVLDLGLIELSFSVGGGAKGKTLMINGAKLIALKSAELTANKVVLDRAACLVLSAQAYLAA